MRFVVAIPTPPSANRLHRNGVTRDGKPGRYKTSAYSAWADPVENLMRAAWIGAGKPRFARGYSIDVDAGVRNTRDLDNLAKPILDRLVAALELPDDRWCDRVQVSRAKDRDDCLVTISGEAA